MTSIPLQPAPPPFSAMATEMSTQEQLVRENKELRSRCHFLESDQQRNKYLALEWQNFGKHTAQVLKNEVETADKKLKYLETRVEDLRMENKELKDVCLYLDQTQGGDSKLTPPELSELLAQTKFLSKLNLQGLVPHLSDSVGALKGSTATTPSLPPDTEMGQAIAELGKRVKRLETEKLELVKSLSAAHMLVANTHSPTSGPFQGSTTPRVIEHPPKPKPLLMMRGGQEEVDGGRTTRDVSPETIANAVMLLDMIQRVDAAEVNGYTDCMEEAEVETLKTLIAIAWQRIQEQTSID